jgi:hypothetical protein
MEYISENDKRYNENNDLVSFFKWAVHASYLNLEGGKWTLKAVV